ncbi:MAG: TraR/DksA family transcriptional regulator [Nitrospinota bacterium]|nr:TraR/DksA family transcriptional regulator [Nitrospinota bacterium]
MLVERLNEVRRDILGDVEAVHRQSNEIGTDGTQDIGDLAAATYSKQVMMELGERERERLREVEDAFKRIEDGTYGICQVSDEPIPFTRLEVIPYTRFTVAAQGEMEQRRKAGRA